MTQERLHLTDDGQVRLQLRHPWRDGTTDVVFDPLEFLGLLAVLVPRPRINLILYHGVLGPRAAWRADVVRRQTSGEGRHAGGKASAPEPPGEGAPAEHARQARGQCWASLMARTFGLDVLACPRCGGRLRLIALIDASAVSQRILRHLGLPTAVPQARPARQGGPCCPRRRGQERRRCARDQCALGARASVRPITVWLGSNPSAPSGNLLPGGGCPGRC